jgi:uncharacterized ferritin-like protein (DUF455 family)
MADLFQYAEQALACTDPIEKAWLTRRAARERWDEGLQLGNRQAVVAEIPARPGGPEEPELVSPRDLKQRKLSTPLGRATLLHAVAHIEFNAINLAWDALYRFRDFPEAFYDDWLSVALDESRHFCMLSERLNEMGHAYGDFPAHNGLWQMAIDTAADRVARMALVPRVMEARGLDVTPAMMQRLRDTGDDRSADILDVILREEVGHVAIGTRWFHHACEEAGLEPETHFWHLIETKFAGGLRGPFNYPAREEAGFSASELEQLRALDRQRQSA